MAIREATLVRHPFGCYAIKGILDTGEEVPEDREPFFQNQDDAASLAEHLGFRHVWGSWEEQEDFRRSSVIIAAAQDWLDANAGMKLDVGIVDAYFNEEDRGWQ